MHTQSPRPEPLRRRVTGRLGVAVLGALVLAVAGPVGVASAATPTSITIAPADTTGKTGQATSYTVTDQDGQDVTASTTLQIAPDGTCTIGSCTPAKLGLHTVTATNGGATTRATLRVPDTRPDAANDAYSTAEGVALTVPAPGVLANDTDADGDPLTATLAAGPANGTVTLNPNGSFTYTPKDGFSGRDSFTYTANDGRTNGISNTATVVITVGAAPTLTLTVSPAASTIAGGQSQTYTATQNGDDVTSRTTFAISPTGSCRANVCTPTGPGGYVVTATSGLAVDQARLTVTNRAPVAQPDSYSVEGDTVLTVPAPGVLGNDSDPDAGTTLTALAFDLPTHGALVLSPNGGFVYTPTPGYVGPDSFTYRARDGQPQGASDRTTVSLTVTRPNRAPVAVADAYTTAYQTPLTVPATGVLGNDTDADGNALTAKVVTPPVNGTLALNPNGGFTYTPAPGFSGADGFTYVANDGRVDSAPATVSLTVNGPTGAVRADVTVRLAGTPTAGGTFPLTVTTTNNGPFAAKLVGTAVKLPPGLRVVSAPGGIVARDGSGVAYLAGTIPAARSVTSTITVQVVRAGAKPPITAGVVSATPDPAIVNNVAVLPAT